MSFQSIAAIMFHDIVEADWDASGFPGEAAARYKLSSEDFERHLAEIGRISGLRAVRVMDAMAEPAPNGFLFTVDDGGACALAIADRLELRGWRGHFFVTTDRIGTPAFVTAGEIKELHRRGHVVGSHSASHPDWMSALPDERLNEEWHKSAGVLAHLTGAPTTTASVPGGYYSERVAFSAARAGITVLFNSYPTIDKDIVAGCRVLGRFTVRRGDPPRRSAALVAGRAGARVRQKFIWDAKGVVKSHARPLWDAALNTVYGASRH